MTLYIFSEVFLKLGNVWMSNYNTYRTETERIKGKLFKYLCHIKTENSKYRDVFFVFFLAKVKQCKIIITKITAYEPQN